MLNQTTDFKEEKGKSDTIIERMMNALSPDITTEENWKCEFYANTDNAMLSNKFTKEDIQLGVELLGLRPKAKEKKKILDTVILPTNSDPAFCKEPYRTLTRHILIQELYVLDAAASKDKGSEQRTKIYMHEDTEYDFERERALNFINRVISGSQDMRSKATKKTLNKKVKLLAS